MLSGRKCIRRNSNRNVEETFLPLFPKTDGKKPFYDEKIEKAILQLLECHKDHKAVHKVDFIDIINKRVINI